MQSIKAKIIDYKEGMKIKKPCIIRNMPDVVYHSTIGLSTSGLKMLLDCPALYFDKYLSGTYIEEEKACYKIGKACHKYILEGADAFEKTYWHNPFGKMVKSDLVKELMKRALKNNNSLLMFGDISKIKDIEKFLSTKSNEQLQGALLQVDKIERKEIELDCNELNQIVSLGQAINNNRHAKNAFSQKGESELSIFWVDEETGLWLKCRPDFLPYDCKLIPDYKTCQSAKPEKFASDFINLKYHVQAALYRTGIYEVTKYLLGEPIEVEDFFFVAQEKKRPFITQVYLPEMNIVDYGYKAIRKALDTFLECKQKEVWQTYSEGIITISLEIKPDDLAGNFDPEENIIYLPRWTDSELMKY